MYLQSLGLASSQGTGCMVQAAGTVSGTGCGTASGYLVPQPVPERDGPW